MDLDRETLLTLVSQGWADLNGVEPVEVLKEIKDYSDSKLLEELEFIEYLMTK